MIAYVQGYSDAEEIKYCPFCGEEIGSWSAEGTGKCYECRRKFAVVEMEYE